MMLRNKSKANAMKGRGTVRAIIFLLIGSAGLRLFSSAEVVLANTDLAAAGAVPENRTVSSPSTSKEFEAMLRAFEAREARIKEQEVKIAKRMSELGLAEQRIGERLEELKAAESQLRATVALASTAAEDDLAKLTAVYENMKPKTAAALFQEMAPEFAAGFLARMRPDSAASIMAGMTPEAAYTVSTILAGRNAEVPKE